MDFDDEFDLDKKKKLRQAKSTAATGKNAKANKKGKKKKADEVEERRSYTAPQQNIQKRFRDYHHKATLNSYRLKPAHNFPAQQAEQIITEIVKNTLSAWDYKPPAEGQKHAPEQTPPPDKNALRALTFKIAEEISDSVLRVSPEGFKVFVSVSIAERKGQEQLVASRHLWDPATDRVVRTSCQHDAFFCCAAVYAVYQF